MANRLQLHGAYWVMIQRALKHTHFFAQSPTRHPRLQRINSNHADTPTLPHIRFASEPNRYMETRCMAAV